MKRFLVVAVCALPLLAWTSATQLGHSGADPQHPGKRTLSVNGEAELRVVPDEVVLTLGVETSDPSMQTARSENDQAVTAIVAAARRAGVPAERIKTDYFMAEPRLVTRNGKHYREAYTVRKTVVVTLADVSAFEGLLSAALAAGATHIHGVTFRTTQLRAHRDRARALALQAAREKAAAMAEGLGQRIGAPLAVSEGTRWWSGYGAGWGSGWQSNTQNVVQNVGEGGGGEPEAGALSPGQIAVSANVSVTFELER